MINLRYLILGPLFLFFLNCTHSGCTNIKESDNQKLVISDTALGSLSICDIEKLITYLKLSKTDTIRTDLEGSDWFYLKSYFKDGTWITFETPSLGIRAAQRISTNSPGISTASGYSVQTSLRELYDKKEKVEVITEGDEIYFEIINSNIFFKIDDKYTKNTPQDIDFSYFVTLPDNILIKEFSVIPNCN